MTGPAMDVTLTNWVPRGQSTVNTSEAVASLVTINSAQDVLSIAVDDSVTDDLLVVKFEIKKLTNSSYVEYFYTRPSNTVLISGQDDSSKRLALRFLNGDNADRIVVYLNGVEVNASGYDRSVSGRIVFKQALVDEANQIRVVVFKQDVTEIKELKFYRNNLATVKANDLSAWSNIEKITAGPERKTYSVFTCTDVSTLQINSRLVLNSVLGASYLLIADAPYSSYDRNLNVAVSIKTLVDNAPVIIDYKKDVKNSAKFYISEEFVSSMFPPIAIKTRSIADVDSNKINDANTKLMNAYIT